MKNKMEVKGNIYQAGVYAMQTKEGEVLYVGSSIEMNDALSRHLYNLKRGLYYDNNKAVLQYHYDLNNLEFVVIHESEHSNSEIALMGSREKESLQQALEVLEQLHVNLNKDTICNKHMIIRKHSSNKNKVSTFRRRQANLGDKNPNSKYTEELIKNILWIKEETTLKNKQIEELIKDKLDIEIKANYIANLGKTKWITVKAENTLNLLEGLMEVE